MKCQLVCVVLLLLASKIPTAAAPVQELVITNNLDLQPGARLAVRLILRASHITLDGHGATLIGPGQIGDPKSLDSAGVGILMEGVKDVRLKNIQVEGFRLGLLIKDADAVSVRDCDFSDNYHDPAHGWGELPPGGAIRCERMRHGVLQHNRANRVWNGLHLVESDDNLVVDNDFSHCSNTAASFWRSSRNQILHNNLSYGIRIDRAAGEVHARDSTCVLIETGSDDNYWFGNDITHGGDGIFIRPLNRWVSRGNVFVENDTSYANNNCVESWSPGNTFIRNRANHGSYGFWLGGSDQTVLIGNEAAYNGLTNGNHNAPEPGFGHGGIVIVSGSSSHTVIEGNHLHDNNGAGIVFRGDVASKGSTWRSEHWLVQQNRIANNRFGIWGRWGDGILLAGNQFTNNAEDRCFTNVSGLVELPSHSGIRLAPIAEMTGPEIVLVGQSARFDATRSRDPEGHPLRFRWSGNDVPVGNILERIFDEPGLHRVNLTVDNGALGPWPGAMSWRFNRSPRSWERKVKPVPGHSNSSRTPTAEARFCSLTSPMRWWARPVSAGAPIRIRVRMPRLFIRHHGMRPGISVGNSRYAFGSRLKTRTCPVSKMPARSCAWWAPMARSNSDPSRRGTCSMTRPLARLAGFGCLW
jgi:parallel beta-helix repeat protein